MLLCCLTYVQLNVIKVSLKDKAGQYRKMPTDLLNIDVYTVDEYQVMRKQMACHTSVHTYTNDSACLQFSVCTLLLFPYRVMRKM